MKRHKWKVGGSGWWGCTKCGLIKEKHFGMPYVYYRDTIVQSKAYYGKAPECIPNQNTTK